MSKFHFKTKIYTGDFCCKRIGALPITRLFLICDPFVLDMGMADGLLGHLKEMKFDIEIYSYVHPDPTIDQVAATLEKVIAFGPDGILAFGGGSAIDLAKAVRFMYAKKEDSVDTCLIAIPTTSGTGSEVTSFSVITDPNVDAKYPLVSDDMLPAYAFLDPTLTISVPPQITADTGMDVLTHSMEALASLNSTNFTDANAYYSIRVLWSNLLQTVKHGEELKPRQQMLEASCMAGIAFNQAGLGICHSMSHALGGRFHIPHGRCNAMLLPHVIDFNMEDETALSKYAVVAEIIKSVSTSDKTSVMMVVQRIKNLMKSVGIPFYMEDLGIDSKEFEEAIPEMVKKAIVDPCTATNPRQPSEEDLTNIYKRLLRNSTF